MRVIVGMATMQGREKECDRAIRSLMSGSIKPDDIVVWNNAKADIDLTDNGKFYGLEKYKDEHVYYLSCDDDLIYPIDYIETCVEAIQKHGCIISFHGRKLLGEGRNYYRGHKAYACLHNYPQTEEIDVPGTGVTAFRTDYFNPVGIHLSEDKKMSDLVFALKAAQFNKKIMHIGHSGNWIVDQKILIENTIYGTENKNCDRQNEIADEIYRIKNGLIKN